MKTTSIYANLPKIAFIESITDAGEYGATRCPHCGAQGRYVYHFRTVDGEHRGAMMGCFKKFPQSTLALKHAKLLDKMRDYQEKGWELPSWDKDALQAIEDVGNNLCSESVALLRIKSANEKREAYQNKKYGRR